MKDNGTMWKGSTRDQQVQQEEEGTGRRQEVVGDRINQNERCMKIPCGNPLPCKLI